MQYDRARVLIADDNASFTEVLCDYINLQNKENIDIIGVATNGLKAVEMISTQKPDIVVLDMIMPQLDGISVLKRVHEMNMKREPLFIILSAVGQNKIIEEALSLSAVYYIEKPFDMDILISKIIEFNALINSNLNSSANR